MAMRHHDARLHAKLIGFAGFALGDTFNLGSMQGVELVLVLRLLRADALGTFEIIGSRFELNL